MLSWNNIYDERCWWSFTCINVCRSFTRKRTKHSPKKHSRSPRCNLRLSMDENHLQTMSKRLGVDMSAQRRQRLKRTKPMREEAARTGLLADSKGNRMRDNGCCACRQHCSSTCFDHPFFFWRVRSSPGGAAAAGPQSFGPRHLHVVTRNVFVL